MKNTLATLFTLLLFLCTVSAQKPQPVQIQTVEGQQYVVEYVPLTTAQDNISKQLAQVNKQLETVDRQIAELVKKRDVLIQQKTALEFAQKQLDLAAAPPPPPASSAPQTAPPPETKKTKKKPKGKN